MKKIFRKLFGKKESDEQAGKFSKKFLSNDFIKRMIRTEQAVSSTFGEHVPYNKTSSYKELSEKEKKDFEDYLKRKTSIKKVFTAFSFMIVISLIFVNVQFTGRAVENITGLESKITNSFLIAAILISIGIFLAVLIAKKIEKKKFRKRLDVLDDLIAKRYSFKDLQY